MKSAVIFLFCLTYFHGVKSNEKNLYLLQIDVLKHENIVNRTNSTIVYQFTNNEELIATCRRKKAGGRIKLTWYKSGLGWSTTTEDKLVLRLILNKDDHGKTLECRLRVEDSQNNDIQNYQEGKWVQLKYTTSLMKKYVPSSVEAKTEGPPLPPPPPALPAPYLGINNNNNDKGNGNKENGNIKNENKENGNVENDDKDIENKENSHKENGNVENDDKDIENKENSHKENGNNENEKKENNNNVYVYASIILAVILVILLLIFITRKMYKKIKVSKETHLKTTAKSTINDAFYEDSGFQETTIYSVPYSQAEIFSGSPPVEAHKTLDTADYSNLINNNYYNQNKKNYQNLYYNVN